MSAGRSLLLAAMAAAGPAALAADAASVTTGGKQPCVGTFTILQPKPDHCLEPIETDRPHRTDTPHALDAGHFQVELGLIELAMPGMSEAARATAGVFNNSYKIGLASDWGVLRGWDLEVLHQVAAYELEGHTTTWNSSVLLRTKLHFFDGPVAATLVPVVSIPVHRGERLEAGAFVFLGGELPFELDFELNVGGVSESDAAGGGRALAGVLTSAVTRHVTGPFSTFVEFYNERTFRMATPWNASFDTGVLVQLHPDLQLDFGVYLGAHGEMPAATPFLGLSGRL